jgi:LEA14-like dessication related protein
MQIGSAKARQLATVAALALSATTLAGCRSVLLHLYRQPTITLRNAAFDIGTSGGSLRVELLVKNPNFYSLSTAAMRYQLLVGDSVRLATGVDSTHRRVAANDSAVVELPVHVSWQGLSAAGSDIAAHGLVSYQIVGTITLDTPLGNHDIPVNQRGSFAPFVR